VNTTLYDPALYTPLNLRDRAELVFGKHWEAKLADKATAALNTPTTGDSTTAARSGDSGSSGGVSSGGVPRRPFRFISTFKWEARKGWDILLEAYLAAFTAEDDVE
jgi:hypothetical protein